MIIIGAGPAGITASVYAARKKMNFLVITGDIGGQAAWSGDIENYTGYQFITGPELAEKFSEHMHQYDMALKENEIVSGLKKEGDTVVVRTNKGVYESRTAIVASGKRSRELSVPGEKEFKNKGLTYCATCDAPLFLERDVAVIGGGNSGLDATIQLIKIARHIYLINTAPALTGDKIMQEQAIASDKVTVLNNTRVTGVEGDKFVTGIRVNTNNKEQLLDVSGVFIEIGLIPNSEFTPDLEKNELKEIKVDLYNRTNIPGIFAAGDVTNVPEKQIIIAAGEGSKAALSAFHYIISNKF